jgi:hypothetical protein
MAAFWKPLPVESGSFLPLLFISATFSADSYTIYLTDLVYIWSESLDHKAIIKRSMDENSPIDLEDGDPDQLLLLLDKIRDGLDGARNTAFSLSASLSNGVGPKNLRVSLEVPLPRPFPTLIWPIYLQILSQSALAAQLTIPLLRAQNARLRELDDLVERLKEKDHVIQKLVDKLEATGAELGHVFPGAAGKGGRKIPRKLAEDRVKGLGPFDAQEWKTEVRASGTIHKTDIDKEVGEKIANVFASEVGKDLVGLKDDNVAKNLEKWWDQLGKNPRPKKVSPAKLEPSKEKEKALTTSKPSEDSDQDSDDEFQVQATPPHLEAASKNQKNLQPAILDESTEDEDDLDADSQVSAIPDSLPLSHPKPAPKRLGAIGGSRSAAKAPAKSKTPEPPGKVSRLIDQGDDDDTASEDENEVPPPKLRSPPDPKPKRGTLGKIGGKKREATPPPARSPEPLPTPSSPVPVPASTKKPKRLGQIGNKASTISRAERKEAPQVTEQEEVLVERGRMGVKTEKEKEKEIVKEQEKEKAPPPPRETSVERADRKRSELKRELEEKAKAPVKKKRKF